MHARLVTSFDLCINYLKFQLSCISYLTGNNNRKIRPRATEVNVYAKRVVSARPHRNNWCNLSEFTTAGQNASLQHLTLPLSVPELPPHDTVHSEKATQDVIYSYRLVSSFTVCYPQRSSVLRQTDISQDRSVTDCMNFSTALNFVV
jgi:hypothetical protein